ncbi:hypothetical protein JYU34_011594 [Plutella xylostella]|uniref:Uncharacterized protein n=1 Tax=Plutella xylostella TaxID=51655 RepID=A0ABQ7QL02_PLUXY|nr:hypothetical protein JYU34_011594 [Plutella xylostella]
MSNGGDNLADILALSAAASLQLICGFSDTCFSVTVTGRTVPRVHLYLWSHNRVKSSVAAAGAPAPLPRRPPRTAHARLISLTTSL